jgi:hypothetical protein
VDEGVRGGAVTTDSKLEDLQAVSQHVLTVSDRVHALEEEKRNTPIGSERFRQLSDEIEALASEMRGVSAAESDLADQLAGRTDLPTVAEADVRG